MAPVSNFSFRTTFAQFLGVLFHGLCPGGPEGRTLIQDARWSSVLRPLQEGNQGVRVMGIHLVLPEYVFVVLLGDVVIGACHDEVGRFSFLGNGCYRLCTGRSIFADDDRLFFHIDQLLNDGAGRFRLAVGVLEGQERAFFL